MPFEIAKIVTVAETVTDLNLEKLKKLVLAEKYPGANYVIRPDGKRKKITPELKEEIINELIPGYQVERHLQDGDIVLFNRHPSLHRGSLMAHFVKVLPGKTFRLHPAVTFPYNADFDGDEMNIHSPQTEEARSEAKILLNVKTNLISPKNNVNMIGCIKDAITGIYLLSLEEFSQDEANQLLYQAGIVANFSKKKITGNEIISQILPKELNYSDMAKTCLGQDCKYFSNCKKEHCPYGAYLKIKNGEILSGSMDANTFGDENGLLIKALDEQVGRNKTIEIIKKVFDLGTSYITRRGITISVEDLDLTEDVFEMSKDIIKKAEEKTETFVEQYNQGTIEVLPDKTMEESREIKMLKVLNDARTKIGDIVKKEFPKDNPVNYMIKSGGGGNMLNITQMACCVGQQVLGNKRIDIGFTNRT